MVGAAPAARHHVVNLEHLEGKLHFAAVATSFLLAEQYVPILPVVDRRFNGVISSPAPRPPLGAPPLPAAGTKRTHPHAW